MRSPGLAALVADAAFIAHEAQVQLTEQHGTQPWDVDLSAGRFTFGTPGRRDATTYGVQLLGSAAPGPRTWLWSWANPHGYQPGVLRAAEATHRLGEQYSVPELTAGEVPFDVPAAGSPDEPGMALGYALSLAARVASRTWFAYSGRVSGGTRVWMLLDGPVLPAPQALRTAGLFDEVLRSGIVTDHRRAVTSYAALRGVPWDGEALVLPDGRVAVRFDDQGSVSSIRVGS